MQQLSDLSPCLTWTSERLHNSSCGSVGCDVMLYSRRKTARCRNPEGNDVFITLWTSHNETVFRHGRELPIRKSHIRASSQLLDILPDIFTLFLTISLIDILKQIKSLPPTIFHFYFSHNLQYVQSIVNYLAFEFVKCYNNLL